YTDAIPYRLYALSNAGSLFALLSYPILFEPVFSTRQQALSWSAGYLSFVLLCGITALAARHAKAPPTGACDPQSGPAAGWKMHLRWVAMPGCASVLLLAVTNHLSQNVAAIPFLWVLPLSLYLFSFILCFEGSGWYRRNPYVPLIAMAVGSMAYALSEDYQN